MASRRREIREEQRNPNHALFIAQMEARALQGRGRSRRRLAAAKIAYAARVTKTEPRIAGGMA